MLGIKLGSFIGPHRPACQSMTMIQVCISAESETTLLVLILWSCVQIVETTHVKASNAECLLYFLLLSS